MNRHHWAFFLNYRNTAYIKTQLHCPYFCTKNQFFGGYLFNWITYFTYFKQTVTKPRLMPHASIYNRLQLDTRDVAVSFAEGMPLSSLAMSDSAAASEDKLGDDGASAALQSLWATSRAGAPAWEPGDGCSSACSSSSAGCVLPTVCLLLAARCWLCRLLAVLTAV